MKKFKYWFEETWFCRYFWSAITHPRNFLLCVRYPFWKSRNLWTNRFCGYQSTMYEWIPEGWRKAFGHQLTADIAAALKIDRIPKRKWADNLQWEDIKEKYGSLRLYAATTECVQDVLDKYECLSMGYCINCGRPVRYVTNGYILYICDKCASNYDHSNGEINRIIADDIPVYYTLDEDGNEISYTPLEKYNIDFKAIWGLTGDADETQS